MNAYAPNPAFPLIDKLVLSYSSLSTARSCMRKFEFRQMYGVPPFKLDQYAGDAGNAIHRGFGNWLATGDEKKAVFAFARAFPYQSEFLKKGQADRSFESCYGTLQQLIHSEKLRQYEVAQIQTTNYGVRHAVEVPFAIEIIGAPIGIPVYYVGYIDCILYDHFRDLYIATDLKTTRMHMDDPSPIYQFDEQTVPYGIILEHALGKKIEQFETQYFHCFIDLLNPTFDVFPFTKTQDSIHDWYRGLCNDIGQIAKYYNNAWFPRVVKGDICASYGNKCFHADYCMFRDPEELARMVGGNIRKDLFQSGEQPWISAQLKYTEA